MIKVVKKKRQTKNCMIDLKETKEEIEIIKQACKIERRSVEQFKFMAALKQAKTIMKVNQLSKRATDLQKIKDLNILQEYQNIQNKLNPNKIKT